jgi:hypothetical protein
MKLAWFIAYLEKHTEEGGQLKRISGIPIWNAH